MLNKDTSILITGADGFVGCHLTRSLCESHQVTAFILPGKEHELINKLGFSSHPHLTIACGNFNDRKLLYSLCAKATHIVHCAGTMLGATYQSYEDSNLNTIRSLIQACPKTIKKFIFLSSQAVSGPTSADQKLFYEDDIPRPISFYGETKLKAEQIVINSGLPALILRPASILGPEDKTFLALFKLSKKGKFPQIGIKNKFFQIIFIEDLIQAITKALFNDGKRNTYFIANPSVLSWETLQVNFENALGKKIRTFYIPPWLLKFILKLYDLREYIFGMKSNLCSNKFNEIIARNWLCDTSNFCKDFNFKAKVEIDETIKKTLAWYDEKHWLN